MHLGIDNYGVEHNLFNLLLENEDSAIVTGGWGFGSVLRRNFGSVLRRNFGLRSGGGWLLGGVLGRLRRRVARSRYSLVWQWLDRRTGRRRPFLRPSKYVNEKKCNQEKKSAAIP
jgi:hypothetical protein